MTISSDQGRRRWAALFALAIAGCSAQAEPDPLPRVTVSGKVAIDGEPMPGGSIQFDPTLPGTGAAAVGEIVDGTYTIERASGPVPGRHRVMISGHRPVRIEPGHEPGGSPGRRKETIPARYNLKSGLEAEVTPDGPNRFDFDLKSKP